MAMVGDVAGALCVGWYGRCDLIVVAEEENEWLWLLAATVAKWDGLYSGCSVGSDAMLGCSGSVIDGGTGIGLVFVCWRGSGGDGLLVEVVVDFGGGWVTLQLFCLWFYEVWWW